MFVRRKISIDPQSKEGARLQLEAATEVAEFLKKPFLEKPLNNFQKPVCQTK